MKFTSERKQVIVWDNEKNKPLCKFNNSEYETDDTQIIDKLIKLGYANEEFNPLKKTKIELVTYCKNNNIKGYSRKTPKELIILIEEFQRT